MIHCKRAKAQIGRYLDGELPTREKLLLKEHLRGCPSCVEELRDLRELGSLLHGAAVPRPPVGLAQSILTRARTQTARGAGWGWVAAWRVWSVPMRFAAAGTAVAAICAGLLVSSAGNPAQGAAELAWLQARPVIAAYQGISQ